MLFTMKLYNINNEIIIGQQINYGKSFLKGIIISDKHIRYTNLYRYTNYGFDKLDGSIEIKTSIKYREELPFVIYYRGYIFFHESESHKVIYFNSKSKFWRYHSMSYGGFVYYIHGKDIKREILIFKNK